MGSLWTLTTTDPSIVNLTNLPTMKNIFDQVHAFYSSELIYYEQFMPKPGDINQVYFPYCKYTLDVDGFTDWLKQQQLTDELLAQVKNALFNKDQSVLDWIAVPA